MSLVRRDNLIVIVPRRLKKNTKKKELRLETHISQRLDSIKVYLSGGSGIGI